MSLLSLFSLPYSLSTVFSLPFSLSLSLLNIYHNINVCRFKPLLENAEVRYLRVEVTPESGAVDAFVNDIVSQKGQSWLDQLSAEVNLVFSRLRLFFCETI
jgi:hypothetical protein